jgi:hypothetical protein
MAAKLDPKHVSVRHQSMHHFIANAPWDEQGLLAVAREYALQQLERHGPVAAWAVDDTAFPKKGRHSVAVARGGGKRRQLPGSGHRVAGQCQYECILHLSAVSARGAGR